MILCVRTPRSPVIAAWRKAPGLRGRPLVLGGFAHERGTVAAVSDEARAAGVGEGMPLTQAAQCCPQAVFRPVDVGAAGAVRKLLLSTLYAFTPEVGSADEDGYVFLGLDGLRLQWPNRARLLDAVGDRVRHALGIEPALAVGANLFVARVAAGRATPGVPMVVEEPQTAGFLISLPLDVLPLDEDMHLYLELLGLGTVGALRTLSRAAWRRQFGVKALALYDLAQGIDPRRLQPWRPPARIQETAPLEPPLEDAQALQFIARALTDRLSASLAGQGLGARRVLIRLEQEAATCLRIEVRFAYPVTAAADLFAGVRPRLLKARVEAPLERITLVVRQLEPAHVRQPGLLVRRDGMQESLADAVARLQEEYRPGLIQRASLVAGAPPLPGRRICWESA